MATANLQDTMNSVGQAAKAAAHSLSLAPAAQKVDALPLEPHDVPLTAVVTPTRLYGPF